ncbi:hypothetical protein [Segniliparus rugosus]|uniref:hypothetical protein n=1 Tax=Segniliparus rugosus TaxID=286804 RepID=UPI0012EB16B9|nr:hypothetical protein [Segniliparus rugosus]
MGIEEKQDQRAAAYRLGASGDTAGAVETLRRLVAGDWEAADHPLRLQCRQDLAQWLGAGGDRAGAVEELVGLAPELARVFGPGHALTLRARHDLAQQRWSPEEETGAREAVDEWERLLGDERAALGPDDQLTQHAAQMAAYWRTRLAQEQRAESGGPARRVDADVLATRRAAAYELADSGDFTGAIAAMERLLADFEGSPDYPLGLHVRSDIVELRGQSGDQEGALAETEALLPELEREFGADSPFVLRARHSSAVWRRRSLEDEADLAAAVDEWERLLADERRVYVPGDAQTKHSEEMLAHWRARLAQRQEAESGGSAARAPGDVMVRRREAAIQLAGAGDFAGAAAAAERLIRDLAGSDYTLMLQCRVDIAQYRGEGGDVAGAVASLRDLLPELERVFGPDNIVVLAARHSFLHWKWSPAMGGEAREAVADFERFVADLRRVLVPGDSMTSHAERALTYWRARLREESGAAARPVEPGGTPEVGEGSAHGSDGGGQFNF